ncbi:MAG: diacylglycerol kinase family protein [Clostridiales bacterium]|nr:diacylglycerol kinase family protein [Clostridiales bacterium]
MRTLRALGHAARGLYTTYRREVHFRFQVWAGYTALSLGYLLQLKAAEMALLLLVIGLVWVAELFNSAVESILDIFTREWRRDVGEVKDLAAGAVLLTSLVALAVGILLFLPRVGWGSLRPVPWELGALGGVVWVLLALLIPWGGYVKRSYR